MNKSQELKDLQSQNIWPLPEIGIALKFSETKYFW